MGEHLLLLGKDLNDLGQVRYNHVRVDWNEDSLTKSFLQTLDKLEYRGVCRLRRPVRLEGSDGQIYSEFIEEITELTEGVRGLTIKD